MKPFFILLIGVTLLCTACSKHKTPAIYCPTGSGSPITRTATHANLSGPVVIYKTKYDYSNNVSVLLSTDLKQVEAYPGVHDVTTQRPVPLANGYYMMLMPGNAFTSYTITQYAAGAQNYTDQDFLTHVIDCAPFTEYWVGTGSANDTADINHIIRSGQLSAYFEKLN